MGNTFKLGNYVNAIFQDASNNVGIGAAPSGSYKLEVTGTAKVSSTLLVSGAATFSSSVTAGGNIFTTNDAISTTAGSITKHSVIGLTLKGVTGSVFDFSIYSASGTALINNPAGTNNIGFSGGQVSFTGGNVGIGTSSPTRLLNLYATTPILQFTNPTTGVTQDDGLLIYQSGLNSVIENQEAGYLGFLTTAVERMRITSAGYLKASNNSTYDDAAGSYHELYSNTAGNYAVTMTGQNATNSGLFIKVNNSSTSYSFLACYSVSVANYMLYIRTNGAIYSNTTSITPISSDVNLKTDILDYDKGLNEVLAMKPRYFKYKDNLEEQKIGFIAQEMDEALPGSMINGSENPKTKETYKTYQVEWYPLLVKAIQEQNQIIQELNERLNKAGL
jgi:hypothetical protein